MATPLLFGFTEHAYALGIKDTADHIKSGIDNVSEFVTGINHMVSSTFDFFKHFRENIANFSLNLLTWMYQFLSNIVLTTPLWLFDNGFVKHTTLTFSIISISVIILLTMIESIKQMVSVKHTKFKTIMKRLPFVLIGAGVSPFVFKKLFQLLNQLTHAVTQIGATEISNKIVIESAKNFSGLDTFALLGFDIILIGVSIPIILYNGRRWFDLISLACVSPLALTCSMFEQYKHIYHQWLSNVKRLSFVQLVYAIFITLIGLLIFSTKTIVEPNFLFVKLLIIIGGFWRLANPPQIVSRNVDSGADLDTMIEGFKDAITLKDTRKQLLKPKAGQIIKKSVSKFMPIKSINNFFKGRK